MSGRVELALANCLKRIESGEITPEEALRYYPGLRAELEPLLRVAMELRSMPKVVAPESLRSSKRPVFLSPTRTTSAAPRGRRPQMLRPPFTWTSPLARLAAGLAAVVLTLGGTMVASASSLPEEPLYPLKLAIEGAQLALVTDPEARAGLEMEFATRRLEEVDSAARLGKTAAVERGLALYEEKVDSALQRTQAAPPLAEVSSQRLQDTLAQQQETLSRVYAQVPQQAKPAILHALEVAQRGQDRSDKIGVEPDDQEKGKPRPTPGASGTAVPTAGIFSPTGSPTATATFHGEGERDLPGRAATRPTETVNPQNQGDEQDKKQDGQQREGKNEEEKHAGRSQQPAPSRTRGPALFVTPQTQGIAVPLGATPTPERSNRDREKERGNAEDREPTAATTPKSTSATVEAAIPSAVPRVTATPAKDRSSREVDRDAESEVVSDRNRNKKD